jgi:hypothetical protein
MGSGLVLVEPVQEAKATGPARERDTEAVATGTHLTELTAVLREGPGRDQLARLGPAHARLRTPTSGLTWVEPVRDRPRLAVCRWVTDLPQAAREWRANKHQRCSCCSLQRAKKPRLVGQINLYMGPNQEGAACTRVL